MITLIHANTNRNVYVARSLIYAIQYSDAHKCTHIISNGGAIIPVVESPETVRDVLEGFHKPAAEPAKES